MFSKIKNQNINSERTSSFSKLADKKLTADTLLCTKACRAVTVPYENTKEYGVCHREVCFFAHSQEELKIAECSFGENCIHMWGKYGVPNSACKFKHFSETVDEYRERSGVENINLPKTSEFTRLIGLKNPLTLKDCTPPPQPFKSIPRAPTKWDNRVVLEEKKKTEIVPSESDSESDSESESESDSDSDSELKVKKLVRRKLFKEESTTPITQQRFVIRVPNNELATFALQAALDRGQYNIEVVIDN
jgi:hypothetical protein